jgi:hypothetical protein
LETISDSKRILQISTGLETVRESSIKENQNTHDINHTTATPNPTPTRQHLNTSPPQHYLISPTHNHHLISTLITHHRVQESIYTSATTTPPAHRHLTKQSGENNHDRQCCHLHQHKEQSKKNPKPKTTGDEEHTQ